MRRALAKLVVLAAVMQPGVTSAQPAAEAAPANPVAPVKLLSAGEPEHAQVLKYGVPNGTRLRCRIDVKSTSTLPGANGESETLVQRQRWVMGCEFSSLDDGASRVVVRVLEFKPLDAEAKEDKDPFSKLAGSMYTGVTGNFLLSARGVISAMTIGMEPRPDRTELIMLPLSALFVPIPAEPVGDRASWSAPALSFAAPAQQQPGPAAEDVETFELLRKPAELLVQRDRPNAAIPEAVRDSCAPEETKVACSGLVRLASGTLAPISAAMEREIVYGRGGGPAGTTKTLQVWNITVEEDLTPRTEEPERGAQSLPDPTVRVLDAGLEPRVALAPRPIVGEWADYELSIKQGQRRSSRAEDAVEFPPRISIRFRLTVVKADDDWATCDAEIKGTAMDDGGVLSEAQRAATKDELARLIGKRLEVRVSLAPTAPKVEVRGDGAVFLQPLEHARVATPSEPVGVGAEWKLVQADAVAKRFAALGGSYEQAFKLKTEASGLYQIDRTGSLRLSDKQPRMTSFVETSEYSTGVLRPGALFPDFITYRHGTKVRVQATTGSEFFIREQADVVLQKLADAKEPEPATPPSPASPEP